MAERETSRWYDIIAECLILAGIVFVVVYLLCGDDSRCSCNLRINSTAREAGKERGE